MNLINIFSLGRTVYLFCRDDQGNLQVTEDNSYHPYYYEPHYEGQEISYDNVKLKKIFVSKPNEIRKMRSPDACEADISFVKKYMLDKIDKITSCPIKSSIIDIETLSDKFESAKTARDPISCISYDNSFTNEIKTFYLGDYVSEYEMLEDFITQFKAEQFDICLGWNFTLFDYLYMSNRIPDLSQRLSPIGKTRWVSEEMEHPAGLAIIDLMEWDKKVTLNRRDRYSLEAVLQKELGRGKEIKKIDFSKLTPELKQRNINDVKDTRLLANKMKYIEYFDEIRRMAKVEWNDLLLNSRMIDQLLLAEAKNQKIRLPMKPNEEYGTLKDKESYEGAFRQVYELGAHFDLKSYDLSSAYPQVIMDFCLDPTNVIDENTKADYNIDEPYLDNSIEINKVEFLQNPKALLPTVTCKLLTLKQEIGKEKDNTLVDDSKYKNVKLRYNAIKTLVNSCYGTFGNRFFRLYNRDVASATTFLVRSVLHYIKDAIEAKGIKVVYIDTDSIYFYSKENIVIELNELIQKWANETFGKEKINLEFVYEGIFKEILIIAMCRYKGWLEKPNGEIETVVKGIESRRKDSTVFLKKFQTTLIDKILKDKLTQDPIISWIKTQIEVLKNEKLENISFPCKMAKEPEKYKNTPIFVRASRNTPNFEVRIGNPFYYVFMNATEWEYETKDQELIMTYNKDGEERGFKNLTAKRLEKACEVNDLTEYVKQGYDGNLELVKKKLIKIEEKEVKGKPKDVMAFDDDNFKHIDRSKINWDKMIQRNITSKITVIFEAMGWDLGKIGE